MPQGRRRARRDSGRVQKDIDEVMANQSDLMEIVHTLKQLMCVKG
jgi:RNA-splicing ligase RtcB